MERNHLLCSTVNKHIHGHTCDILCTVVARASETAFGVCYDACFSQINLAFGKCLVSLSTTSDVFKQMCFVTNI